LVGVNSPIVFRNLITNPLLDPKKLITEAIVMVAEEPRDPLLASSPQLIDLVRWVRVEELWLYWLAVAVVG
jgi:hypothetical protein